MTVTMNTYGNRSQSIQNGRLQYIPRASFVKQRYGIPQYQTLSLQRPNLYPIFQNTHQSWFPQVFQPRFQNNQYRYPFHSYNQIIPRMSQLAIGTVSGRTQPTIEFPTKNRENDSGKNG